MRLAYYGHIAVVLMHIKEVAPIVWTGKGLAISGLNCGLCGESSELLHCRTFCVAKLIRIKSSIALTDIVTEVTLYSYPPVAYSHSCSCGGKHGGIRTIYFWRKEHDQILMLVAYPKSRKDNLTVKEATVLRDLVKEL